MSKRLRVGVLFGGRSTEHEVSVVSAQSILNALDPAVFEAVPIYINRAGQWQVGESIPQLVHAQAEHRYVLLPPDPTQGGLIPAPHPNAGTLTRPPGAGVLPQLDAIFPIIHGLNGEDGTVQGLLELANVAYVGAGVLGSAVGLDKVMMKKVFAAAGLPVVDHVPFSRSRWEREPEAIIAELEQRLGYPCFTKFANSGSSVGTSKVRNRVELIAGINRAAPFDRKLLVERAIDAREIEVSVLGNDDPVASVCGEVVPAHEFYDYEAKYLEEGSRLIIPAELDPAQAENIRELAVAAFRAADCAGMGRVDFFLERGSGKVYVNEINTLPGFTKVSMFPKLWEASGVPYPELVRRLIDLALARHRDKQRSQTSIDSRLLEAQRG
jgi:D-alanine-D-alanine ligase